MVGVFNICDGFAVCKKCGGIIKLDSVLYPCPYCGADFIKKEQLVETKIKAAIEYIGIARACLEGDNPMVAQAKGIVDYVDHILQSIIRPQPIVHQCAVCCKNALDSNDLETLDKLLNDLKRITEV